MNPSQTRMDFFPPMKATSRGSARSLMKEVRAEEGYGALRGGVMADRPETAHTAQGEATQVGRMDQIGRFTQIRFDVLPLGIPQIQIDLATQGLVAHSVLDPKGHPLQMIVFRIADIQLANRINNEPNGTIQYRLGKKTLPEGLAISGNNERLVATPIFWTDSDTQSVQITVEPTTGAVKIDVQNKPEFRGKVGEGAFLFHDQDVYTQAGWVQAQQEAAQIQAQAQASTQYFDAAAAMAQNAMELPMQDPTVKPSKPHAVHYQTTVTSWDDCGLYQNAEPGMRYGFMI